jgi:acyl carrier protein
MKSAQFLGSYEKLWEIPCGTLKPEMRLDELSDWDSLATLSTIAWMDREFGIKVTGAQIAECRTFRDVLNLAEGHFSD